MRSILHPSRSAFGRYADGAVLAQHVKNAPSAGQGQHIAWKRALIAGKFLLPVYSALVVRVSPL